MAYSGITISPETGQLQMMVSMTLPDTYSIGSTTTPVASFWDWSSASYVNAAITSSFGMQRIPFDTSTNLMQSSATNSMHSAAPKPPYLQEFQSNIIGLSQKKMGSNTSLELMGMVPLALQTEMAISDVQKQIKHTSPELESVVMQASQTALVFATIEKEAENLAHAKKIVSNIVSMSDAMLQISTAVILPEVGIVRSALELTIGRNLLTGEILTPFQRAFEVLGALTMAKFSNFTHVAKALDHLARSGKPLSSRAHNLVDVIRKSDRSVSASSISPVGTSSDSYLQKVISKANNDLESKGKFYKVVREGEMYSWTALPKWLQIELDGHLWLIPENVTKHILQFSESRGILMLKTPVSSLVASLQEGIRFKGSFTKTEKFMAGDWELVLKHIPGDMMKSQVESEYIVHHALYRPR